MGVCVHQEFHRACRILGWCLVLLVATAALAFGQTVPAATDQTVTTSVNVAKDVVLSGTDADNDPLTYRVVNAPTHGALSGTAPNLTYTPATAYIGNDQFTFVVNDGAVYYTWNHYGTARTVPGETAFVRIR